MKLIVSILAGGMGKRMNSDLPKVLHKVGEIPMIVKILYQVILLNPSKIIIVVGNQGEIIKSTIEEYIKYPLYYVVQNIPLGTGDAVKCTLDHLDDDDFNLILNGDTPLLSYDTITNAIATFKKNNYDLQITGIEAQNPTGCGRLVVSNNIFLKIVEEKDCTEQERLIKLINCGIYICKNSIIKKLIPLVKNNNNQKEYYITDIVEISKIMGYNTGLFYMDRAKETEIFNVNTKNQLEEVNKLIDN